MHYVDLKLAGDTTRTVRLSYSRKRLDKRQSRLIGRIALVPAVCLRRYTCRAVIDWIDVHLQLARATQHQWIRKVVAEIPGPRPFVRMLDRGPGDVSSDCRIRVQDPFPGRLAKLLRVLEEEFGIVSDVFVDGLEVAMDFYSKSHADEDCLIMVGLLSRHLLPKRDVISRMLDRPRVVYNGALPNGTRKGGPKPLLAFKRNPARANELLRNVVEEGPPADGTVYIGERDTCPSWRIMHKRLDHQNPATGTREVLSRKDQRARCEVTIGVDQLRRLGVTVLKDLQRVSLARLQRPYFAFVVPTLAAKTNKVPIGVVPELERLRIERFLYAGAIGLLARDQAWQSFMASHHKRKLLIDRQRGLPASRTPRKGTGARGTFIAYEELNRKVENALSRLGKKLRSGGGW